MEVVGEEFFQEQLAALAGPKKETGYYLPVLVTLIAEPADPRGEDTVRCFIDGRPVGYLDDQSAQDPGLRWTIEKRMQKGRPLAYEGLIVGGWSRLGELDEMPYRVEFPQEFGSSELDAGLDDLLRIEY